MDKYVFKMIMLLEHERNSDWYINNSILQVGQSWRSGTKCDCKIDWLWVRSPLENIYLNLYFHYFAQHEMPPEIGRKWRTECLNTRFPLPTSVLTLGSPASAVCGVQREADFVLVFFYNMGEMLQ